MATKSVNGVTIDLTAEEESTLLAEQNEWLAGTLVRAREKMIVSRFQAVEAIDRAGLLGAVESIMVNPQTTRTVRNAWNNAQEFKRLSPTVISLGQTLGLTDTQLDDLFTQAKNIEA